MGNRRSAREKRFSNGTWGWTAEGATSFLAGGGIDFYDAINGSPSMTAGRKAGFRKTTIERYVGVDGCKGGWFAVVMGADGGVTMGCHGSVAALWRALKGAKAILIDIPIGLVSESGEGRRADSLARKALAPWRHRSVFSPLQTDAFSRYLQGRLPHQSKGLRFQGVDPDLAHSSEDKRSRCLSSDHP